MLTISKCQNGSSMRYILFSSPCHSAAYLTSTPTQTIPWRNHSSTILRQKMLSQCVLPWNWCFPNASPSLKVPLNNSFLPRVPFGFSSKIAPIHCLTHCTPLVTVCVVEVGSFNERLSQPKDCERNEVNFRNGTIGVWALNLIAY